jgi:hypothetical protein
MRLSWHPCFGEHAEAHSALFLRARRRRASRRMMRSALGQFMQLSKIAAHKSFFFGSAPFLEFALALDRVGDAVEPLRVDQRHRPVRLRVAVERAGVVLRDSDLKLGARRSDVVAAVCASEIVELRAFCHRARPILRDARKSALLRMRLTGSCGLAQALWTFVGASICQTDASRPHTPRLILRSPPQAGVSKDGRDHRCPTKTARHRWRCYCDPAACK